MKTTLLKTAGLAALLISSNVSASLIGDTITVTNFLNGGIFDGPTQVVAVDGGGPELINFGDLWDIDFEDSSFHMVCSGQFCGASNFGFDEYLFEGLDWNGTGFLSDATLNPASTFGAAVSLAGPTSVLVAYSLGTGLPPAGVELWIDLESVHVPEPATLALFGLGLAGLGISRRKRIAQS
jgi:hypothetical protein